MELAAVTEKLKGISSLEFSSQCEAFLLQGPVNMRLCFFCDHGVVVACSRINGDYLDYMTLFEQLLHVLID
jgi:hypothetical protein